MNNQYDALEVSTGESRIPSLKDADIVIIGNGITGLTAALEGPRLSPEIQIIITQQSHPSVNPPLLKQFAARKIIQDQLLVYLPGTRRLPYNYGINVHVEKKIAQSKCISLSDEFTFGYASLLLATHSIPIGLPAHLPRIDFDGVPILHDLSVYLDLRPKLGKRRERE